MPRDDFNDMLWFLTLADSRNFTKAAAKLGVAQSTLSHSIKRLEAHLGLRLLTRTTRSVALTEAGERVRDALAPRIADIDADIAAIMSLRDKPSGTIRITLSDYALDSVVWPKLRQVLLDYPDINVELNSDNGFRNIVEDGFDAGVRLGESLEKDMIAVRISEDWRLVAVASPAYLAAQPPPTHPQQLTQHRCINARQSTSGGLYAWDFEKDGQTLRVRVGGQLTFNTSATMIDAAIFGYGIAYVPESLVTEHVSAGRLQLVLDDWSPVFAGFFLYYPSRRQNSAAFGIVLNALRAGTSDRPRR